MKMATIYCGLNAAFEKDGPNKTEQKIKLWLVNFAEHFGGYTKQVCTGGWLDENKKLVTDTTLRIELLLTHTHHEEQLHELVETMPASFYQDCIMLTVKELEAEFIYQDK